LPLHLSQAIAPDSLRRALDKVFAQTEYRWTAPTHPLRWLRNWWLGLLDWLNGLESSHPVAYYALLVAVSVALLLLLTHIGYVVWRITRPSAETGGAAIGAAPVRILDARAHAARAEELARAGRYAEALGHRFLSVLLELEQARAVRFHASKTPAEYVGEVRLDDAGRATFSALVARLYRHLFGALPCDELEYREFGATAEQLRRHVLPA
jgi:hypothetical protein